MAHETVQLGSHTFEGLSFLLVEGGEIVAGRIDVSFVVKKRDTESITAFHVAVHGRSSFILSLGGWKFENLSKIWMADSTPLTSPSACAFDLSKRDHTTSHSAGVHCSHVWMGFV